MTRKPRLGFLGLGWIGQHRMKALLDENPEPIPLVAETLNE